LIGDAEAFRPKLHWKIP